MPDRIRLLSGTANPRFSEGILQTLEAQSVKTRIVPAEISRFPDGEVNVQILETVRGYDIYVVQPTCPPVDQNLMELCVVIDALKRASAQTIIAVIPYFGYARQERKAKPRVPITAKLVADFIEAAGAHRVVTMDLHAGAIQGFFNIPVDNLSPAPIIARYLKNKFQNISQDFVIVSADFGSTERARFMAAMIPAHLALIEKRRDPATGKIETSNLIGDVKGKSALIVDDILSTGTTLAKDAAFLVENGAREVWAAITHGVFAGAMQTIEESALKGVFVTNTIPPSAETSPKVAYISATEMFADVIRRINEKLSVSAIFNPSETPQ